MNYKAPTTVGALVLPLGKQKHTELTNTEIHTKMKLEINTKEQNIWNFISQQMKYFLLFCVL